MRRVVIESPFAPKTARLIAACTCEGDPSDVCEMCAREARRAEEQARNLCYLRDAMRDCLTRSEAPFASHGLYTQPGVLNDEVPAERELGIKAGYAWWLVADVVAVYIDLGISPGMQAAIERATAHGMPIEHRTLSQWRTQR